MRCALTIKIKKPEYIVIADVFRLLLPQFDLNNCQVESILLVEAVGIEPASNMEIVKATTGLFCNLIIRKIATMG
jgi:hypothetical protein